MAPPTVLAGPGPIVTKKMLYRLVYRLILQRHLLLEVPSPLTTLASVSCHRNCLSTVAQFTNVCLLLSVPLNSFQAHKCSLLTDMGAY